MEEFKRIDFVGAFLMATGLCLFILGVSWGGNPEPWDSSKILGLLITGILVLIIFFLYGKSLWPLDACDVP